MTSPSFRHLRRMIYTAKRRVGQPIYVCRTTNVTINVETGVQDADLQKVYVRRAIILPATALRSFAYDLSFIAANKNFTYGGFFDKKTRICIVSKRDLDDMVVDQKVHLIIKDKRCEVKTFAEYEDEEVVAFSLDQLENALPLAQIEESVTSDADLGSEVDEP